MTTTTVDPPSSLDDEFPKPFGPYLLLGAYARGGMGEVYLAKTGGIAGIEKFCVLKKLRPDLSANDEYVRRFIDEARIVVTLNHSNVAQVFDVGRVGRDHYLAMEHVSGLNLRQVLDRAKARGIEVPLDVSLQIATEMLEGLDYAHRRRHPVTGQPLNLVHRDVSPHNVMVSFEGEVKLIDFGLAASELKVEQTESQVVMGKVAYMSPEQARGDPVDGRTDQFAAAIIVTELLIGDRYYGEMPTHEIWQHVGNAGYRPVGIAALDEPVRVALERALSPAREDRFGTCGELREAVHRYHATKTTGGGRSAVRAQLAQICSDDMESDRAFLSRFAHVSAARVREATEGTARNAVQLVAASTAEGSGASESGPKPAPSFPHEAVTEATVTSSRHHLQPASAQPPAVAQRMSTARAVTLGATAMLLIGAVGALVAVTTDPPPPALTTTAPPSIALSPTAPMPSVEPAPSPVAAEPVPLTAPPTAPPPSPAIEPVPVPPTKAAKPKPKLAPAVPVVVPAPAPPPVPVVAAAAAPPPKKLYMDDKLKKLRSCSDACAQPLTVAAYKSEAAKGPAAITAFTRQVDACLARCTE